MNSHSVELRLLGQRITLKSEADPVLVREVVELVSTRIKEAEGRAKSPVPYHIALLALLDLAEEYVQAKKRAADQQAKLQDKSNELLRLIEAEFK